MRAAPVRAPGSGPSHLGPPKARIMSISWKPWPSLGAPSPADAHDARACGAHHEVTVAGGSSIIEFAGAAPRRPKTCPNATRNACAFRSHSPANFEFPRPCRPRRGAHHEHQRDPRDAEGGSAAMAGLPQTLRLYGFARLRRPMATPAEGACCTARLLWPKYLLSTYYTGTWTLWVVSSGDMITKDIILLPYSVFTFS